MVKFSRFILLFLLTLTSGIAFAAEDKLDTDGYPLIYLRGAVNYWECDDNFLFTRENNKYTLTLAELDGEFKIAGSEWGYNYGRNAKVDITRSTIFNTDLGGGNMKAVNLRNVTLSFTMTEKSDKVPIELNIVCEEGNVEEQLSGTLPVLYINVLNEDGSYNDEVIDKDLAHKNYMNGIYWLDINGCEWLHQLGAESIGSKENPLPLEIKARGNFTRTAFAKKPFKLKLGSKESLLGLSKSKHYAILAHADDTWGYLRNFCGFNLGKRIGLPWTPSQQPVEVVINGDYRGLYFLTESIRVEKDRVDIAELEDNETAQELISGGYLVELDNYDEGNQIRMQEKGCTANQAYDMLRITWDTPEEYSDVQRRFVTEQFTAMNNAIGDNSDDVWRYLDMDDAARFYLVHEIISNTESYHGSTYLFRDNGEGMKWHFSPIWDCGNAFSGSNNEFFYNCDPYGNTWIPSLRENVKFNEKVRQTWLWFMNTEFKGFYKDIDEYVNHIEAAAKADWKRWKGAPTPVGGMAVVDNTNMNLKRNNVVNHLLHKIDWLKEQFGDFNTSGITTEPERDDTPAAPLPSYATSAIESIGAEDAFECEPQYFNLQGIAVSTPLEGEIYIVKRGYKTVKEIYK